nr:cysteine proteinases superfamily protein [Tanacetum cinerariifolium]
MLDKFIDEGKREHEEMEIFIKKFRTTNELLLKERSNLLSELKIEVNELSRVIASGDISRSRKSDESLSDESDESLSDESNEDGSDGE